MKDPVKVHLIEVRKVITTDYTPKHKANKMYNQLQKATITHDFITDILIDTRNRQQKHKIMRAIRLQTSMKKYFLMNSQGKCLDNKMRREEKLI